jgi:hypothetical protein
MGKTLDWNKGQTGMERDPLVRDESARKYPEPKDIEDRVNRAQTVHEQGFAARLPRGK